MVILRLGLPTKILGRVLRDAQDDGREREYEDKEEGLDHKSKGEGKC